MTLYEELKKIQDECKECNERKGHSGCRLFALCLPCDLPYEWNLEWLPKEFKHDLISRVKEN